ncbi:GNAT superfamily N-acetyltransferase [Paraburkholderia youngii]|uniref:GNAT family N-acetyltransferase n=1 Tax=Paraburkholderia youngii TaxID=2782701 RepID=UPI003D1B42C7
MPHALTKTQNGVTLMQRGVGRLTIRPLDVEEDSVHAVNALERYARSATLGGFADEYRTSGLLDNGCGAPVAASVFIALCRSRIAGMVSVASPDANARCEHYRRPGVAVVRGIAVEPTMRHHGIGRELLAFAERYACRQGCTELALDVPYEADGLLKYCRSLGFSLVDVIHAGSPECDRAVFSRPAVPEWKKFSVAGRATNLARRAP